MKPKWYIFIQFIEKQGSLHVLSITCSSSGFAAHTAFGIMRAYNSNIPNAVCVAPPKDEQVMLETCRGPWFSINWMKNTYRWFFSNTSFATTLPFDAKWYWILKTKTTIFFVMKTNQMHYLSLIYFVNQPLHVSDMYIAHHQEVFSVHIQQLVRVIHLGWMAAGRVGNQAT
jgi:hypothetical protein